MRESGNKRWVELLADEDLAFIKRFVLASGSLKEMARVYGITYPTIRLRLDRLIEKIKVLDSGESMSRFERLARGLCAEEKIDLNILKILLTAHQADLEDKDEKDHSDI